MMCLRGVVKGREGLRVDCKRLGMWTLSPAAQWFVFCPVLEWGTGGRLPPRGVFV